MNIKIIFLIFIIIIHCYLNMNIYEGHETGINHVHEPGDPLGDPPEDSPASEGDTSPPASGATPPTGEGATPPSGEGATTEEGGTAAGIDEGEEYQFITNIEDNEMDELKDYIRYLKCGDD